MRVRLILRGVDACGLARLSRRRTNGLAERAERCIEHVFGRRSGIGQLGGALAHVDHSNFTSEGLRTGRLLLELAGARAGAALAVGVTAIFGVADAGAAVVVLARAAPASSSNADAAEGTADGTAGACATGDDPDMFCAEDGARGGGATATRWMLVAGLEDVAAPVPRFPPTTSASATMTPATATARGNALGSTSRCKRLRLDGLDARCGLPVGRAASSWGSGVAASRDGLPAIGTVK